MRFAVPKRNASLAVFPSRCHALRKPPQTLNFEVQARAERLSHSLTSSLPRQHQKPETTWKERLKVLGRHFAASWVPFMLARRTLQVPNSAAHGRWAPLCGSRSMLRQIADAWIQQVGYRRVSYYQTAVFAYLVQVPVHPCRCICTQVSSSLILVESLKDLPVVLKKRLTQWPVIWAAAMHTEEPGRGTTMHEAFNPRASSSKRHAKVGPQACVSKETPSNRHGVCDSSSESAGCQAPLGARHSKAIPDKATK